MTILRPFILSFVLSSIVFSSGAAVSQPTHNAANTDGPMCTFYDQKFSPGVWICTAGHMRQLCDIANGTPTWTSPVNEPACEQGRGPGYHS